MGQISRTILLFFFSGEWFTGECGWEHSTDGPGFWSPTPPSGSGTGECLF